MRNKSILLCIFLTFSSCDIETKSSPCSEVDCPDKMDVRKWRKEVLDRNSVLINGRIPLVASKNDILNLLGEPDQRIVINYYDATLAYLIKDTTSIIKRWTYGRTIFEEIEDKLILTTLHFESTPLELVFPQITLKADMDMRKLCPLFPESCKLIELSGNAWSGHLELMTSKNEGDPRKWFLMFRTERLVKVVLYHFSKD
jgi:hypothetical protein